MVNITQRLIHNNTNVLSLNCPQSTTRSEDALPQLLLAWATAVRTDRERMTTSSTVQASSRQLPKGLTCAHEAVRHAPVHHYRAVITVQLTSTLPARHLQQHR
jgi:hypothetical protein